MTQRFYSSPLGSELPPDAEVVWNGTHDKALSQYWQAQATAKPTHLGFGQPPRATFDLESDRVCDRVLRYLVRNRHAAHTARTVAAALDIDARNVATWLHRFKQRGVIERDVEAVVPSSILYGRACYIYRVRPMAEVS